MKKKLAIITTHPIQYNAPMFSLLAQSKVIEPKVFYTWSQAESDLYDKDFDRHIQWDIPLTNGYASEFVTNTARDPGPHHFKGIINPNLKQRVLKWNPDGMLVYGWNYKSHLKVIKYFGRKIPVWFRGDSTLIDDRNGLKSLLRKIVLNWVYRDIKGAFYVGSNNYDYFRSCGIPEEKLHFAPHAIDNERFGRERDSFHDWSAALKGSLSIDPQDPIVLFVGKFEPKKDPLLLINAFKEIKNKRVRLLMIGNGIMENQLKSISSEDGRIHFLPFQNQSAMPDYYKLADILVLPSAGPGETWGLVVNEAMAAGCAVVASDRAGSSRDLVINGRNGYQFRSGNKIELQSKLEKMLESPSSWNSMGRESRRIISKWSFEEICKSLEQYCFRV